MANLVNTTSIPFTGDISINGREYVLLVTLDDKGFNAQLLSDGIPICAQVGGAETLTQAVGTMMCKLLRRESNK